MATEEEREQVEEALVEALEEAPVTLESLQEHYATGTALNDGEVDMIADIAVGHLRDILACFGEEGATIDEFEGEEGELILDVSGGDLAILIGRHGRTLEALQLLLSSLVNRELGFHFPVTVDIEGYRERRRNAVTSQAIRAAARVKKTGREVKLSPMNAYERRLVHLALRDDEEITTVSEGEDPDRRVVVLPAE